jgi:hypothetical protein
MLRLLVSLVVLVGLCVPCEAKKGEKENGKPAAAKKEGKKKSDAKKGGKKHREPQAKSDAQLRQAQGLLKGTPSLAQLKEAKKLLECADHDYDGHRAAAVKAIDKAIAEYGKEGAAGRVREAIGELGIALGVK